MKLAHLDMIVSEAHKQTLLPINNKTLNVIASSLNFVHLDTTYWGRSFGVLLALDSRTGKPLYMAFVKSETTKDYEDAVASIHHPVGVEGV